VEVGVSFKDDLKEEAKTQAKAIGARVVARGFRALMDRFAAKPLFKAALVRNFRRIFRGEK
jgi:hypothetical protein